jgi:hypothetical protein
MVGVAGAAMCGLSVVGAQAQPTHQQTQCFYPKDFGGWKATPDSKSIYIRVGANRVYRLDLAGACFELQAPDAHLITHLRGSGMYCTALDFDLKVSEDRGIAIPCIVSGMTELTPDQTAALAKNLQP